MSSAPRDDNHIPAIVAENDTSGQAQPALIDNTTGGIHVHIVGGSSSGTEYTEGDTDTTFSGSILLAEGPSNTATPLQVDGSKHLQVDIAADSVGIGGGTQYTEGDTDASITGNALLFEGAADTLVAAPGTAADGLLVNLGANNDITGTVTADLSATDNAVLDAIEVAVEALQAGQLADGHNVTIDNGAGASAVNIQDGGNIITVDGTITANAGTNLNTSALALETGGNLAIVASAVFAEDALAVDGDKGIQLLAIRQASLSATVGEGDYTPLKTDTEGRLWVNVGVSLPSGTNAIGKLAANSGVDIGDVDVTSLPALAAGTNLVGKASVADNTAILYNGTTELTPKFDIIDAASSGDNTLLAAVSSKKIRVLSCFMVAAGAVNARFESGAGGTALTGQMNLAANGGFVLPYNPLGWFETAPNTLLNLELSAATSVDGSFVYVEV